MAVLLLLGEDQLSIEGYFEEAAVTRQQLQLVDLFAELIQERVRQADGLGEVVSHAAVFDGDGDSSRRLQSSGLP